MPDYSGIARAAYIRAASTALAVYEYLRIFPTAIDFYMAEWRRRDISVSLVLFVLIRVTSITLLIVSSYAIFYPHFTYESCSKYFLASPVLKLMQISVSQCIMAVRTYNLAGRWKPMGVFLLALYTSACLVQWICILHKNDFAFEHLEPAVVGTRGSCLPATLMGAFGTWVFYAVAIVYDLTVSIICAHYLIKYKHMVTATFLSKLIDAMIYDGLFYFLALTAINIVNLVFMQSASSTVDVTAVGAAYTLVWILSQRIVLTQYRAQESRSSSALVNVLSKPQRPYPYFTPEAGPSGGTRTKHGDISDRHKEGIIPESVELKSLMAAEDGSDRRGAVAGASTRPSDLEATTPLNRASEVEDDRSLLELYRETSAYMESMTIY